MKCNFIFLQIIVLILGSLGCSHTIKFRNSYFNSPVVGENAFSGHFAAVAANPTSVTLVNDISSNPPSRTSQNINEDIDIADIFMLSTVGFDFSLAVGGSVELMVSDSTYGVKWQFLNPGTASGALVGSIRAGMGNKTSTTSQSSNGVTEKASSEIRAEQFGLSLGYAVRPSFVPYVSYISDLIYVSTDVVNSHGTFNDYKDKGNHEITSIGFANAAKGLDYGIEYNMINIKWDRSERKYQNSLGLKIGARW